NRRQQAYVGANDGLLHAFNTGYYHRGDDPTTTTVTEHGWYTTGPADNSSGVGLGEEVWGYVPYQRLPQLGGYTGLDYKPGWFWLPVRLPPHHGCRCAAACARVLSVVRSRVDHQLSDGGPHEFVLRREPDPHEFQMVYGLRFWGSWVRWTSGCNG